MEEPPDDAGACHMIVALFMPGMPATFSGADGVAIGVTWFDATDAGPCPIEFVARTVNV